MTIEEKSIKNKLRFEDIFNAAPVLANHDDFQT